MPKAEKALLIFFAVLAAAIVLLFLAVKFAQPYVEINNNVINVEIADEPCEQAVGLSGRESLGKNQGMLFAFSDRKNRSFWMKNMNFPLDIIWIDGDKIIKIHNNLPPEGDKPNNNYFSGSPVDYALEVNANYAAEHKIKVGDVVKIRY